MKKIQIFIVIDQEKAWGVYASHKNVEVMLEDVDIQRIWKPLIRLDAERCEEAELLASFQDLSPFEIQKLREERHKKEKRDK